MTYLLVPTTLFALGALAATQTLPYTPTRVFLSPNSTLAYIFESSDGSALSQLGCLDLTRDVGTTGVTTSLLYGSLPFESGKIGMPYTPVIDQDGNILVVAGDCSEGASSTRIWRFEPDAAANSGNGSWTQYPPQESGIDGSDTLAGSNYLAGAISFPGDSNENATTYVFGGMCPFDNSTTATWTSNAQYSNQVLVADPNKSAYEMSIATTNGPPIAEAGFSITGLPFSSSTTSDGTVSSVQQDFVLIGGHTHTAFINMSQVALFSLPQRSWTFLPVQQPMNAGTDLAVRQSSNVVEPRSGHTAVLSEDNSSLIVFGGWVGDITNPAQPQLAILQMGSGYGGSGEWTWTIPETSGTNTLASGEGIYGHGATMLPGGVMMVIGGHSISARSSRRSKRATQAMDSQVLLFNTTSKQWLSKWSPPANVAAGQLKESEDRNGPLSTTSEKAGLGVGLAAGLILLAGLIVFYFWYTRRLRRAREERERRALTYSSDGSLLAQQDQPFLNKGGIDGRGGDMAAISNFWESQRRSAHNIYPWDPTGHEGTHPKVKEADSTGLFMDNPSPTRGLRKGLGGRPYLYHQAARYDEKRVSGSGGIHTIAERDDEDQQSVRSNRLKRERSEAEVQLKDVERALRPRPMSDPFADPLPNPLGSHPVSPEMGETVRKVPAHVSRGSPPPRSSHGELINATNLTASYADEPLLQPHSGGRTSPTKTDDRTSSTLSERSTRSTVSSNSITRTMSTRTGAILAAAAAAMSNRGYEPSSLDERSHTMSSTASNGRNQPYPLNTRTRSSTNNSGPAPNSAGTDAESFMTARSNFANIQAEGEALLGGRPAIARDDPYGRAMATFSEKHEPPQSDGLYEVPTSMPTRRRPGWMGSLRRAIGAITPTGRSMSMTNSDQQQYNDFGRSTSSSPTKDRRNPIPIGSAPRRAVSDGGALLRQKRGRQDWQDEHQWPPYRDDPDAGDWGEKMRTSLEKREAEEDWDVEDAAQKRDFQIMFTVPKTRLRVVNADVERASMRSASDSALSRSESLRREESVKGLRARAAEGEGVTFLPATEEEGEREDAYFGEEPEREKEKAA